MVIKYILFNSFFPDHAWNPSEQLLDILADTTNKDEAHELKKYMENIGLRVVIQKYNVVHEDNFNRYIIIDEVEK